MRVSQDDPVSLAGRELNVGTPSVLGKDRLTIHGQPDPSLALGLEAGQAR